MSIPNFYITTTLPYVNADPHIGFAMEVVRADAIARFKRLEGQKVFFNTGTDEHGAKIFERAEELKMDPQEYCDQQFAKWQELQKILNLSFDNFIRTTDEHHIKAAQKFWQIANDNGYIYKKFYKTKYCVGCELEKTESELVDGRCPLHPNRELEIREEENYFFKFSAFQKQLLDLYKKNPDFVVPKKRFNEIKKFVEMGLEDFSISRLKSKMPWGVEVPGDPEQVMYVWFDALVNYVSAIGWPASAEATAGRPANSSSLPVGAPGTFCDWWPGIQVAGKDNLRQQSAMWQAMLMAVGIKNSAKIYINSFLTSGGQKMSKSLGNVISPYEMIEKFGTDGTRYLLLSLNTFGDDMDITWQGMTEKYNADLANGLGNLVGRVSNLLEKNGIEIKLDQAGDKKLAEKFGQLVNDFKLDEALKILWNVLRKGDEILSDKKPWKMEDKKEIKNVLEPIAQDILNVAILLQSFMPEISGKIIAQFSEKQIKKGDGLFPRI